MNKLTSINRIIYKFKEHKYDGIEGIPKNYYSKEDQKYYNLYKYINLFITSNITCIFLIIISLVTNHYIYNVHPLGFLIHILFHINTLNFSQAINKYFHSIGLLIIYGIMEFYRFEVSNYNSFEGFTRKGSWICLIIYITIIICSILILYIL